MNLKLSSKITYMIPTDNDVPYRVKQIEGKRPTKNFLLLMSDMNYVVNSGFPEDDPDVIYLNGDLTPEEYKTCREAGYQLEPVKS